MAKSDFFNDTSQFDVARRRAQEQYGSNLQNRRDALARRFAALGNLDSGARLKQEELAANAEAANLTNANEGIQAAQNAEMQRRREILQGQEYASGEAEKGRKFATGERLGGQQFVGEQGAMQRQFLTGERVGSQEYQTGEAGKQRQFITGERVGSEAAQAQQNELQRGFLTSERQGSQDFQGQQNKLQLDQQERQFRDTLGFSKEQFAESQRQFKDTFNEEVRVNDANINFNNKILDQKGILEQLFSNFSLPSISKGIGSFGKDSGLGVDTDSNFTDKFFKGVANPTSILKGLFKK